MTRTNLDMSPRKRAWELVINQKVTTPSKKGMKEPPVGKEKAKTRRPYLRFLSTTPAARQNLLTPNCIFLVGDDQPLQSRQTKFMLGITKIL